MRWEVLTMKLKTSFFNPTVLRKDATRFAPVWGLYTVFMLMTVFLIWADESEPARFAANAPYIMMCMGVVNFFYAGICALLLFGDLFQSKMAGALHAMPLRREGWFLTHFCAGILFCVVPNALGTVIASMILQEYCYLAFLWLGIVVCQFLFFFGAAAFSVQCAGNKLGATAVYGLFNLLAVLWAFLADTFYTPLLYGIQTDWAAICKHSPVLGFSMSRYVEVEYDNMYSTARFEGFIGDDWRYLLIAAAVGVALLIASVLLYRSRHMETAGDFMAVKPAAPVFLVIYTLCVGAVLYFLADQLASGSEYVFLIIGFALGFFTGWMLLEKKVNVFQLKKWMGLGAMTLVFFLTIAITAMDPFGITRYVPEASQIQSVDVSPYASDYYLDHKALTLSDAEDVQKVLDIHSRIVQERSDLEHSTLCLRLRYNLRSGATVDRTYYIDTASETGQILKTYLSDFRYVTMYETVDAFMQQAEFIEFYSDTEDHPSMVFDWQDDLSDTDTITDKYGDQEGWVYFSGEAGKTYARGLMEAIYSDCQAGNMAQNWDFHYGDESVGNLNICISVNRYMTQYQDITIYGDCENTVNYLKFLATP